LYGGPSSGGRSAAITFGIQNVIEAKFRSVSDSGRVKYTKKNIIENFGVSGNYNLLADSFNLSNLSFQLNTRLLNKINLASSWTLDPYAYGNRHIAGASEQRNKARTKPLAITSGQGLGTITSANFSVGFNFNPAAGKKKKELPKRTLSEAEKQELSFINANPNLFVDFTIPWSLNMQYNAQYQYIAYGSKSYTINQYMQISGDVSLAPKWKLGYSAPFDFQNKKFASTSLSINRDLHCWEMAMNLILAGTRPSYTFRINVKASILQDLKLSKQNNFYDR
jgi:alpha-glucosidase (family GH31 glycosyl hydrolase)